MSEMILVIENFKPEEYGVQLEEIVKIFGGTKVIQASSAQMFFQIIDDGGVSLNDEAKNAVEPYGFYKSLVDGLIFNSEYVIRINAPNYPLHEALWTEIRDGFPAEQYNYVLSSGEECALLGYFVERINKQAMHHVTIQDIKVMPSGYLNASLLETAGRHWFSLDLTRFYYEDQFEVLFDSPRNLSINAFGQCNFSCRKCQYHSSDLPNKRDYGAAMSLDQLKIILEKVKAYKRLQTIYPTITGEPLMHPDIVQFVRMVREAGYGCSFTTNASMLTKQMTHDLLDAGIGSLAFSVDTTDPEIYHYLQEGGELSEVESNILYFQEQFRLKHNSPAGAVNFVLSEVNKHNVEAYYKRWHEAGLYVQISTYYDIFDNNRPYYDNSDWGPGDRKPCWALWQGLFLTNEGRVVSCGAMAKTLGIKENIFTSTAEELWRCEAMNKLRRQQLTGAKPGYCKEFTCWTGMNTTWVAENDKLELRSQSATQYAPKQENTVLPSFPERGAGLSNRLKQYGKSILSRLSAQ